VSLAGTPYLAGSSANMLFCMNHLASFSGLTEQELWHIGFDNPLRLLGKDPKNFETFDKFAVTFSDGKFSVARI
ncbi:MAG: hypothetical protein GX811_03585, partial [Lentisphaerae bacterium]|nr:hypothetical protein [Lentisphaerota bacterium]